MVENYTYPQSVSQTISPSEGAPWVTTNRPTQPWPGMFGYGTNVDTFEFWCATARAWRRPAWVDGSSPFTGQVQFNAGIYIPMTVEAETGMNINTVPPSGFPLLINQNLRGIYPDRTSPEQDSPFANWIIVRDSADFRNSPDRGGSALAISHNLLTGFKGGRSTLQIGTTVVGVPANTLARDNQWSTTEFTASSQINVGGTSVADPTTTVGTIYGFYPQAYLLSGATNWFGIVGAEVDIGVQAGASVYHKRGHYVTTLGIDAVAGVGDDFAYGVSTLGSTVGWRFAYTVGSTGGTAAYWVNPTYGALFGITTMVEGSPTGPKFALQQSKFGFNLSEWVATDSAFLTPGLRIDGDGSLYIGGGKISYAGNQFKVDNPGQVTTAATLSGATVLNAGNRVGDRLYDRTYHGIYEVATINGSGSALTFNIVKPSFTTAAVPHTTIAVIGGSGGSQTISLDVTWAASTGIYIGETGGFTRFGSGTWAANGAVATALTSVGPTGSHTTVQEWFVVRNASNVVRYIPAF